MTIQETAQVIDKQVLKCPREATARPSARWNCICCLSLELQGQAPMRRQRGGKISREEIRKFRFARLRAFCQLADCTPRMSLWSMRRPGIAVVAVLAELTRTADRSPAFTPLRHSLLRGKFSSVEGNFSPSAPWSPRADPLTNSLYRFTTCFII